MKESWHADRAGRWVSYWRAEAHDPSAPYISTRCTELSGTARSEIDVDIALEQEIALVLNGTHIATLSALPVELPELAVGFLLCEGVVEKLADLHSVQIRHDMAVCDARPSCEVEQWMSAHRRPSSSWDKIAATASSATMDGNVLLSCVEALKERAVLWRRTGGTHSSMVCTHAGDVVAFSEDVSRMSSVDRAVGKALFSEVELDECALITTGRLSGGVVAKAARVKIPIVASKAAPLSGGVELARRMNMTLVGFARSPNLYVYAGAQRIT